MSDHTPGPWKVEKEGTRWYEIHYGEDGECVAEIVHDKADAKLIAAAPDMLEALEAIAGNHDAGPGIDAEQLCELMTRRAMKVLAKVRGNATPVTDLGAAVVATLGGVGACSPEHYRVALEQIAKMCHRQVDDAFRAEVRQILELMPRPMD
jgi:hypothetical protein